MDIAKVKDYEEILKAAQLYIDGCAKGDGELMRPAFMEGATINGAPIASLFEGATQAGPGGSTAHVDVLDAVGDVAVIRVYLQNYFGKDYVDFHSLLKTEKGWQIAAKVFTEV
ncbi:MAG: nuclear transport factor 2 family protein [Clostridiales bacterium]|nr:nuclear transport factor 2 family protein [Clostridiales bacterium]